MYTHILATTDGSELALRGVAHAAALAAALDARLTVLTVSEPWNTALADPTGFGAPGELVNEYRAGAREQADACLAAAAALAGRHGVTAQVLHVEDRAPAEAIIDTAREHGCDLVVMASHGRSGLGRLLLGSQTQAVVGRSSVPVLVVR